MSSVNNTIYGVGSLEANSGSNNTAIGAYTLVNNTTANQNSALGSNAMYYNTTGDNNTAVGSGCLCFNSTGISNTAIGSSALEGSTAGSSVGNSNVAIGVQALYNSSNANNNTAVGSLAGLNVLSGTGNTVVGASVFRDNTTGSYNTAIGTTALFWTNRSYNTAIGVQAGNTFENINSDYCTYIGGYTGHTSNSATNNYSTAVGYNAVISASNQIVLGTSSEGVSVPGNYLNIGGSYNKSSGYALEVSGRTIINSGPNIIPNATNAFPLRLAGPSAQGSTRLSSLNFGFNMSAGDFNEITDFSDNIIWWTDTGGPDNAENGTSGLVIGPWNSYSPTPIGIRISNDGLSVNTANGSQSLTAGYALYVDGSANFTGQVYAANFISPSDYRIKENVTPLDTTFVVDNLNPVKYTNTKTQKQDVGFIAHELQEVYPFLVNGIKDGEQFQSVNYIGLIGILTKEIQDMKKRIKTLEGK